MLHCRITPQVLMLAAQKAIHEVKLYCCTDGVKRSAASRQRMLHCRITPQMKLLATQKAIHKQVKLHCFIAGIKRSAASVCSIVASLLR
jgi:hypothetical protein